MACRQSPVYHLFQPRVKMIHITIRLGVSVTPRAPLSVEEVSSLINPNKRRGVEVEVEKRAAPGSGSCGAISGWPTILLTAGVVVVEERRWSLGEDSEKEEGRTN